MELIINGAYKHIKTGGSYWVLAIASPVETPPDLPSYSVMHSETEELFQVYGVGENAVFVGAPDSPKRVIYQAIARKSSKAPAGRWGRPYKMFCDGRFEKIELGNYPPLREGQPTNTFERSAKWQCTFSIERDNLAQGYYLSCNSRVIQVFLDQAYQNDSKQSLEACQIEFHYITQSVQSSILSGYLAPSMSEEESAPLFGFSS